jgi:hypothetical protein
MGQDVLRNAPFLSGRTRRPRDSQQTSANHFPMKRNVLFPLFSIASLALSGCVGVDESGNTPGKGPGNTSGKPPVTTGTTASGPEVITQPLSVSTDGGTVTIREGSRTLSSFNAALPNVEETRWYSEQEKIVVKSRGSHGPATVQLFDARSGREEDRVLSYEISNGYPAWGTGMAE